MHTGLKKERESQKKGFADKQKESAKAMIDHIQKKRKALGI